MSIEALTKLIATNPANDPTLLDALQKIKPDQIEPKNRFKMLMDACRNSDNKNMLKLLAGNGFDLNMRDPSETDGTGAAIIHKMILDKNADIACFLVKEKLVDINLYATLGSTPLQLDKLYKLDEVAQILIDNGAITSKIGWSEFPRLLDDAAKNGIKEINIKQMLEQNGYAPNLDGIPVDPEKIKKEIFDKVDFSGVSFRGGQIATLDDILSRRTSAYDVAELKFHNCDMRNANLYSAGVIKADDCFNGANIEGLRVQAVPASVANAQNLEKAKIIFVDTDRIFSQGKVIAKMNASGKQWNEGGVCNGLCIEYGRYFLKDRSDAEKAKHSNAIGKFLNKEVSDANFVKRIELYQNKLQNPQKCWTITNVENGSFTDAMNSVLGSSKMVGLGFYPKDDSSKSQSAHGLVVRVVEEAGEKKYRLFDPNFGESPVLTAQELDLQVKNLYAHYRYDGHMLIDDLEQRIKGVDLLSVGKKYIDYGDLKQAMIDGNIERIKDLAKSTNHISSENTILIIKELINDAKTPEAVLSFLENSPNIDWKSQGAKIYNFFPKWSDKFSYEVAKLFVSKGADLKNALHQLLEEGGDSERLDRLVKAGVDFTKEDGEKIAWRYSNRYDGLTPEMIKMLVAHKVDFSYSKENYKQENVSVLDNVFNNTQYGIYHTIASANALLENGATLCHKQLTKDAITSLIMQGYIPFVKMPWFASTELEHVDNAEEFQKYRDPNVQQAIKDKYCSFSDIKHMDWYQMSLVLNPEARIYPFEGVSKCDPYKIQALISPDSKAFLEAGHCKPQELIALDSEYKIRTITSLATAALIASGACEFKDLQNAEMDKIFNLSMEQTKNAVDRGDFTFPELLGYEGSKINILTSDQTKKLVDDKLYTWAEAKAENPYKINALGGHNAQQAIDGGYCLFETLKNIENPYKINAITDFQARQMIDTGRCSMQDLMDIPDADKIMPLTMVLNAIPTAKFSDFKELNTEQLGFCQNMIFQEAFARGNVDLDRFFGHLESYKKDLAQADIKDEMRVALSLQDCLMCIALHDVKYDDLKDLDLRKIRALTSGVAATAYVKGQFKFSDLKDLTTPDIEKLTMNSWNFQDGMTFQDYAKSQGVDVKKSKLQAMAQDIVHDIADKVVYEHHVAHDESLRIQKAAAEFLGKDGEARGHSK